MPIYMTCHMRRCSLQRTIDVEIVQLGVRIDGVVDETSTVDSSLAQIIKLVVHLPFDDVLLQVCSSAE